MNNITMDLTHLGTTAGIISGFIITNYKTNINKSDFLSGLGLGLFVYGTVQLLHKNKHTRQFVESLEQCIRDNDILMSSGIVLIMSAYVGNKNNRLLCTC